MFDTRAEDVLSYIFLVVILVTLLVGIIVNVNKPSVIRKATIWIGNEPKTITVEAYVRGRFGNYAIFTDTDGNSYTTTEYTMWEEAINNE